MNKIALLKKYNQKYLSYSVWVLRIIIGGLFVMSGLVKGIDLWGFIYKIEEYFEVWGITQPHSLSVIIALTLSMVEFITGSMLVLGAYRRGSVWILLSIMAGMLPLSLYIFIANPVADCGCFGDFWILSNGVTLLKNIIIVIALVYLVVFNHRVRGLYRPFIQWIIVFLCFIYFLVVALLGYNIQPLIDFRSFPIGSNLLPNEDDQSEVEFEFIYEKDGSEKSFTEDNLPDSTWFFIDRKIRSGRVSDATELVVIADGEDVTSDVIAADGEQVLIILPEYEQANIAYTYIVNEMQRCVESRGGSLIEIAAIPDNKLEEWKDLSMATYPIYQGEGIILKELSRGVMSAVFINDGKIVWKRALSSIGSDALAVNNGDLGKLSFDGSAVIRWSTCLLLIFLIITFFIEKMCILFNWRLKHRKSKKNA